MLDFKRKPVTRKNITKLYKGDIILYKDKLYIFDKIPNGLSSIHVRDIETKKILRIPISKNLSKVNFDIVGYCEEYINDGIKNDISSLTPGDLFVINNDDKISSFIFRFGRNTKNNIIAFDPMNNNEIRIPISYYTKCVKIQNLPY